MKILRAAEMGIMKRKKERLREVKRKITISKSLTTNSNRGLGLIIIKEQEEAQYPNIQLQYLLINNSIRIITEIRSLISNFSKFSLLNILCSNNTLPSKLTSLEINKILTE